MANWNAILDKHNRKKYKWPVGWDSRETVAAQLDCSPDRVAELLASAISSGEVEKKSITYYDEKSKRKVTAFGYREKLSEPIKAKPKK